MAAAPPPACRAGMEALAREDARIRLVITPDLGAGGALNAGVARATGAWIGFLDEADVWLPEKITMQLETAYLMGVEVVGCRTIPSEGARGLPALFPPPGPPECALGDMADRGQFIAGISHTLLHRRVLQAIGPFVEASAPQASSELWRRLGDRIRSVVMWHQLVASPLPFLMPANRRAAAPRDGASAARGTTSSILATTVAAKALQLSRVSKAWRAAHAICA